MNPRNPSTDAASALAVASAANLRRNVCEPVANKSFRFPAFGESPLMCMCNSFQLSRSSGSKNGLCAKSYANAFDYIEGPEVVMQYIYQAIPQTRVHHHGYKQQLRKKIFFDIFSPRRSRLSTAIRTSLLAATLLVHRFILTIPHLWTLIVVKSTWTSCTAPK